MDSTIREIYRNLIQGMEKDEISRKLEEEIRDLLEPEKNQMSEQEFGEYRDKAFLFANAGEEAGFVRGFRYALQLLRF